jgi:mitogen-activated protein kinase 1/3
MAIKKMDGVFDDEIKCKRIFREVDLLRKLRNPYVIIIFDMLESENPADFNTVYIVLRLSESDRKKVIKSAIHLQLKHI